MMSICWGKVRTDRSNDGSWDRRNRAAHDAISSRRATTLSPSVLLLLWMSMALRRDKCPTRKGGEGGCGGYW